MLLRIQLSNFQQEAASSFYVLLYELPPTHHNDFQVCQLLTADRLKTIRTHVLPTRSELNICQSIISQ